MDLRRREPLARSPGRHRDPGRGLVVLHLAAGRATCCPARPRPVLPRHPLPLAFELASTASSPSRSARRQHRPFSATFVLRTRPRAGRADSHALVFRYRYVGRGMREDIVIRNYGDEPAFCSLELAVDADFADLFDGQGGPGRARRATTPSRRRRARHRRSSGSGGSRGAACTSTLQRAAHRRRQPRRLRGHRARPRQWTTCVQLTPVIDDERDRAALPLRPAGRAGRRRPSGSQRWRRTIPPVETDHDGLGARRRRSAEDLGRAAHLRPRLPRAGGRGRRRAVVHDAVRPRLAHHVVDGAARRPRPRARRAADPGPLPGQRGRPAHRGGAGPHPARDALRRRAVAVARRRPASTTAPPTPRRCS